MCSNPSGCRAVNQPSHPNIESRNPLLYQTLWKGRQIGAIYIGAISTLLLMALAIMAMNSVADTTTVDGDWIIATDTNLDNGTWIVKGAIIVSDCKLTIRKSIIVVNSTVPSKNQILVNETGRLVVSESVIRGGSFGICIEVYGDTTLRNTTITNLDWRNLRYGVYHESGVLEDTT